MKLDHQSLLVVDDCENSRELLTLTLQAEGAKVTAVAFASEALEVLPSLKPNLLLCDIALPDTDGCSLLRQIRAREGDVWKRIPAIAITALDGEQVRKQVLAAGFELYLLKPVDLEELITTIFELTQPKVGDFAQA